MKTHESMVADRYYSRFGCDLDDAQLNSIPLVMWDAIADARGHRGIQDAYDAILDFLA